MALAWGRRFIAAPQGQEIDGAMSNGESDGTGAHVGGNGHSAGHGMLYTDMYQLTMAQVYYRLGLATQNAQFDYFFRSYPAYGGHAAGYCINAGLGWLLDWMDSARFDADDLAFLGQQQGRTGTPLFDGAFLQWLRHEGTFGGLAVEAIPEGRVVHPGVPLAVVRGPLAMAQILETGLLNHLNYQTLVATKAARVRDAGHGQMMLEFGMRRAQGEAANAGARAALIGGADYTSNVEAAQRLGVAPKGTRAQHGQRSWPLAAGELEAFRAYAGQLSR
jgi:nicotinate phosphoribosyltransferase